MESVPVGVFFRSETASRDLSRSFTNCSAYSRRTSPAGVRRTDLRVRSNSFCPYSSSSWRICALTAGCDRKTLSAAREKLPSRATSRNVLSWSKSIRDQLTSLRGRMERDLAVGGDEVGLRDGAEQLLLVLA